MVSDFAKRTLVTVAWFSVIAAFIWIKCVFLWIITGLSVLGVYEFYNMVENKGIFPFYYLGLSVAAFIPLSLYYGLELNRDWQLFLVITGLIVLFLLQIRRKENEGATFGISVTLFGVFYISWTITFLLRLRLMEYGIILSAMTILATKSADIMAYIIGSKFGRRKFMPRVSPNKTWEGFWAGVLMSLAVVFLFSFWIPFLNWKDILLLGVLIGVFGQLGDISESLIKRDCYVKDSSRIFSVMGGVLDTLDSLLFSSPIVYFYITRVVGL